jgi:hypothetical protein
VTKIERELAKVSPTIKGSRCSVATLYASIEDEERGALKKSIEDYSATRIPSLALSQAIAAAYGLDVHRASIDRHRRKDCLCWRTAR